MTEITSNKVKITSLIFFFFSCVNTLKKKLIINLKVLSHLKNSKITKRKLKTLPPYNTTVRSTQTNDQDVSTSPQHADDIIFY